MISVLFWAIWRRLYGEGKFKKYLSRTMQTIMAVMVLTWQLPTDGKLLSLAIALVVSAWVVIQYWSRAVGCIIDAGLNFCQGRKNYNRWFRTVCNWIVVCLNKILPEKYHIRKYYGIYDWIYSGFRNLVGILPALFLYPSWQWIIPIICQYPIYRFCYWVFKKIPKLYKLPLELGEPKNSAEILHGAVFGAVICGI